MTQPRKEQIKNLKTKYRRMNSVGSSSFGNYVTQDIKNTVLESFYDEFLAATETGVVGGAETSSPAIAYGGFGPWALLAGDSFNISLPLIGVVHVVINVADVITLGGIPVVTTSNLVYRINQAVAAVAAINPMASNVEGQIVLSYTDSYGLSSYIMLEDLTPGVLNTIGFTTSSSITVRGTSAPTRGIITESADKLGGVVQIRNVDGSTTEPINQCMRTTNPSFFNYFDIHAPDILPGQSMFARIRSFPGALVNGRKISLDFYRVGPIKPKIITNRSNFSIITPGDTLSFTINFDSSTTSVFNCVFGTINTAQDVVNAINSSSGSAVALAQIKTFEPYNFSSNSSFFISLNGNAPIHISPSESIRTVDDLYFYISNQISVAGQSSQGYVNQFVPGLSGSSISINSSDTDISTASVEILPGNPGGSTPGTFMDTLNELGLQPGIYRPGYVAKLYGNDEIELSCFAKDLTANMIISSSSPGLMTKLGLSVSPITLTANIGVEKVLSPLVSILVPEVIEFKEEPDNYDVDIQSFDNKSDKQAVNPINGIKNSNISELLDAVGKLDESLLPFLISSLNVDTVRLGFKSNDNSNQALKPKLSFPQRTDNDQGPVLMWESKSDYSIDHPTRMYSNLGDIYITVNAKIAVASPLSWTKDDITLTATLIEINKNGVLNVGCFDSASPFAYPFVHSAWKKNIIADSLGVNAVLTLIPAKDSTPIISLTANSAMQYMSLVDATSIFSSTSVRSYIDDNTGTSTYYTTQNASYDHVTNTWSKESAYQGATSLNITPYGVSLNTMESYVFGTMTVTGVHTVESINTLASVTDVISVFAGPNTGLLHVDSVVSSTPPYSYTVTETLVVDSTPRDMSLTRRGSWANWNNVISISAEVGPNYITGIKGTLNGVYRDHSTPLSNFWSLGSTFTLSYTNGSGTTSSFEFSSPKQYYTHTNGTATTTVESDLTKHQVDLSSGTATTTVVSDLTKHEVKVNNGTDYTLMHLDANIAYIQNIPNVNSFSEASLSSNQAHIKAGNSGDEYRCVASIDGTNNGILFMQKSAGPNPENIHKWGLIATADGGTELGHTTNIVKFGTPSISDSLEPASNPHTSMCAPTCVGQKIRIKCIKHVGSSAPDNYFEVSSCYNVYELDYHTYTGGGPYAVVFRIFNNVNFHSNGVMPPYSLNYCDSTGTPRENKYLKINAHLNYIEIEFQYGTFVDVGVEMVFVAFNDLGVTAPIVNY